MLDPNTLVRAGGIAPASARTDEKTTAPLAAKRFTHPSLGARVVVRLADASLEPAIDAEMSVLGFVAAGESEEVGRTKRRALGFPTWALVHHPKEARFALDVMRDMRKAATRVKTKPGHARDAFIEIGKKLERSVPMFLPSYWEETARAFLAEEAQNMASQFFEKARSAERAYKLKVDEDRRAEAYLEFTLAGAVPAKSLAGYAADLVKAYGAKEGERRFRELAAHRIKGGVPPWTGMGKELRRLAKEAKRGEQEADEEFLREVLDAPALVKAPHDFWSTYRTALVRLAAKDPQLHGRLLWLFPKPKSFAKFCPTWLELLKEIGAPARMAKSDDAGRWLSELTKFVTYVSDYWSDRDEPPAESYFEIMAAVAPKVLALGVPVSLESSTRWEAEGLYSSDVLEAALALGIPVADPRDGKEEGERANLDLGMAFSKDPVHVAADPRYGELLTAGVERYFGQQRFEASAKGKSALVGLRKKALEKRIAALTEGGVPSFKEAAEALVDDTPAELWSEFPDCAKALAQVQVAPALARTLRAGVIDELTWPEFEAAIRELKPKERGDLEVIGTDRFPIVRRGRKVIVFNGKHRLRDYDLPAGVKDDDVDGIHFLDGDLLLRFRKEDASGKVTSHSLWMSKPKEILDGEFSIRRMAIDTPVPGEGGGVTLGKLPIHRGDTLRGDQERDYVTDGERFWVEDERDYDEPIPRLKLLELDPKTGKTGRASWPKFVAEASERSDGYVLTSVSLGVAAAGAEQSRFGVAGGLVGGFNRRKWPAEHEYTRIDGVVTKTSFHVEGLVSMPASSALTPVTFDTAWSDDDDDRIELLDERGAKVAHFGDDAWRSAGLFRLPRKDWFHFLSVRDEAGSRALRQLTEELAEALLEAARSDIEEGDDDDDDDGAVNLPVLKETEAALAKALPELTNVELRRSVAFVVGAARRAELKLASLVDQGAGKVSGKGPTDDDVKAALLFNASQGYDDGFVVADLHAAGAFFRGGEPTALTQSSIGWELVLEDWPKVLCFLASRGAIDEAKRKTLRELAQGVSESGLLGLPLIRAWLSVEKDAEFLKRGKNKDCWFFVQGDSRMFARATDEDEDEPAFKVTILAHAPKGLALPKGTSIVKEEKITIPDVATFMTSFLGELERQGAARSDTSAAIAIAKGGLLSVPEATLLLAGLPNFDERYKHDFLGKDTRAALGIKVTEAKAAQERLSELGFDVLRKMIAQGADVATPSAYWAAADDAAGIVQSMGAAAAKVLGAIKRHPETLVAALASDIDLDLSETDFLTALTSESTPLLVPRKNVPWTDLGDSGEHFHGAVVSSLAHALPYLSLHLPVGDEYRTAAAGFYRRLRAVLDDPELLLRGGDKYVDNDKKRAALFEQFGGKVVEIPWRRDGKTGPARDTGLLVLVDDQSYTIEMAFRPSKVPGARAELERLLTMRGGDDGEGWGDSTPGAVLFLTSKACEALVARIEKTPVQDGSYEGDPRKSAPKLVATVKKDLGLDEDAATLYLQTLALPHPAQKLLCTWNGWTPAQYKQAVAALMKKKGLVVEGKRERAGRDIFLAGGWEKAGGRHVETWKLPMLQVIGGTLCVPEPVHALYERAYARVKAGDAPRFEETRKKKTAEPSKGGKGGKGKHQ